MQQQQQQRRQTNEHTARRAAAAGRPASLDSMSQAECGRLWSLLLSGHGRGGSPQRVGRVTVSQTVRPSGPSPDSRRRPK